MGVDFTAIGEHDLDLGSGFDPNWIARRPGFGPAVQWTREFLLAANPAYRDDEPAWELEYGLRCLRLPGTFRIRFGRRLFTVGHIARWHTFLTDSVARTVLREAVRTVAEVLDSPGIYYLPDSSFAPSLAIDRIWDDGSLEDVRTDLARGCGPRTFDLDVIYREDFHEAMLETGYFYEPRLALPSLPDDRPQTTADTARRGVV